jgi:hypothetical protein
MKDESKHLCETCKSVMDKLISGGAYVISTGLNPTLSELKETDHTKKVKDPERAIRMRYKAFGKDAVGDPKMESDPMHIVKRGKTIGGQQTEIDKKEFIKAAAKDASIVDTCQKALKKRKNK